MQLSAGKQITYAFGMMGWSIMINLISVILVYLYVPPSSSGLPTLITQVAIFGVFNSITLITAGGRLVDAFYDPFIAQISDRSKHPKGRRIPFMKKAIIPSFLFCCCIFFPLKHEETFVNTIWLSVMLIGFYVASTTYIIPYNALLPELAHTPAAKVKLSTWQSVGYVFGIGISSNVFNLADTLQGAFGITYRLYALQYAVAMMALLGAIAMFITTWLIDEKQYVTNTPVTIPLKKALKQTLNNTNFILFIVADFSYFIGVTIITSGLLYFVTVLLQLPESLGNKLMMTMVLISFLFYPIINYVAKTMGKKIIVIVALFLLSVIFLGIYVLGKPALNPELQIYLLIALAAIPLAALNILPNAILAEIIEKDRVDTKENKEAMYFAVRYFFVKIAQTFGIALFSMLLMYGKDIGNDFGIRLNGLLGCLLCLIAGFIFMKFKEPKQ